MQSFLLKRILLSMAGYNYFFEKLVCSNRLSEAMMPSRNKPEGHHNLGRIYMQLLCFDVTLTMF